MVIEVSLRVFLAEGGLHLLDRDARRSISSFVRSLMEKKKKKMGFPA